MGWQERPVERLKPSPTTEGVARHARVALTLREVSLLVGGALAGASPWLAWVLA